MIHLRYSSDRGYMAWVTRPFSQLYDVEALKQGDNMPARDIFHYQARHAFEKDGWVITHDQMFLQSGGAEMYIDLGAEYLIAAQRASRKIAVEVKSFVAPSVISEFHSAVGQYIDYRSALEDEEPDRELYLYCKRVNS